MYAMLLYVCFIYLLHFYLVFAMESRGLKQLLASLVYNYYFLSLLICLIHILFDYWTLCRHYVISSNVCEYWYGYCWHLATSTPLTFIMLLIDCIIYLLILTDVFTIDKFDQCVVMYTMLLYAYSIF